MTLRFYVYFWRSKIAGRGAFFVASGTTFVYFLGAIMPWRWVCLVSAILPASGLVLVWKVVPETPTWLVHHGKIDEARKVWDIFNILLVSFLWNLTIRLG